MGLLDSLKRLLGQGEATDTETEGSDVAVHVEHPGVDEDAEPASDLELEDIKGIGPTYADRLRDVGIGGVAELARADAGDLAEETDISETRLATWIERAKVRSDED